MKRNLVRAAAALFGILFVLGALAPAAFAAAPADIEALRQPDGPTLGISRRGDWHAFPENSEPAILAAVKAGLSMVAADVSLTADGVPVLLEAESASRMLGTEKTAVSAYTYEALAALPLKNRSGGPNNGETDEHILTLEAFLALAEREGFTPVLMLDAAAADAAVSVIAAAGAEDFAVLLLSGKPNAVKEAALAYGDQMAVITVLRSNVLPQILSFIGASERAGAVGVNLKTTNRYGVIFNQTVLGRFAGRGRAVSNPAESETAGAREDTVKWWDDLVSRGYSVILTDDPQQFAAYLRDVDDARDRLSALYGTIGVSWNLPDFRENLLNDYKKAFTDAKTEAEALLGDQSVSLQALRDCYTALRSAMDQIDLHYEALENGTAGKAITLPRILLCAAAAAAVIWVQIFFYKKRKKA